MKITFILTYSLVDNLIPVFSKLCYVMLDSKCQVKWSVIMLNTVDVKVTFVNYEVLYRVNS